MDQQHDVGLDVSLVTTSICVVDQSGAVLWRGKCSTEPTSPMPCCGCRQTAERTMTWQDSSPSLIKRDTVLATVKVQCSPCSPCSPQRGGCAWLRASLDGRLQVADGYPISRLNELMPWNRTTAACGAAEAWQSGFERELAYVGIP